MMPLALRQTGTAMPPPIIICPITGKPVNTGLDLGDERVLLLSMTTPN
jgi:hypothetical protein